MRNVRTILVLFLALFIGISGIIASATAEEETHDGNRPVYSSAPVNQNIGVITIGEGDKEGTIVILPSDTTIIGT